MGNEPFRSGGWVCWYEYTSGNHQRHIWRGKRNRRVITNYVKNKSFYFLFADCVQVYSQFCWCLYMREILKHGSNLMHMLCLATVNYSLCLPRSWAVVFLMFYSVIHCLNCTVFCSIFVAFYFCLFIVDAPTQLKDTTAFRKLVKLHSGQQCISECSEK